ILRSSWGRNGAHHSTRSVVVLCSEPDLTTSPSNEIEYGYVAVTVTSEPGAKVDVTVTERLLCFRSVAELRTCVCTAPEGFERRRATAPLRAPARTASVSVT